MSIEELKEYMLSFGYTLHVIRYSDKSEAEYIFTNDDLNIDYPSIRYNISKEKASLSSISFKWYMRLELDGISLPNQNLQRFIDKMICYTKACKALDEEF